MKIKRREQEIRMDVNNIPYQTIMNSGRIVKFKSRKEADCRWIFSWIETKHERTLKPEYTVLP
jgi:hypothetical protein